MVFYIILLRCMFRVIETEVFRSFMCIPISVVFFLESFFSNINLLIAHLISQSCPAAKLQTREQVINDCFPKQLSLTTSDSTDHKKKIQQHVSTQGRIGYSP